jgi:drug/metabolite transporter (DMT)-like permease
MIPALLATLAFSFSAIVGQRVSRQLGGVTANTWRLSLACLILWLIVGPLFMESVRWPSFRLLLISGVIGFGIGDLALFLAYPLLGARLTVLVVMSTACLWGGAADWVMLGTKLPIGLIGAVILILIGLGIALTRPDEKFSWNRGIVFALIAGFGQGVGGTVSRVAQQTALANGYEINGLTQAAQRALGGWALVFLVFLWLQNIQKRRAAELPSAVPEKKFKHKPFWIFLSALTGPVIGVSCMQWALYDLGSSALVSAVTALSPLMIIPLAKIIDKESPHLRSVWGSVVSIMGVMLVAYLRR